MSDSMTDPATTEDVGDVDGVLVIRRGPGANCSSIGSAVEMLFLSAAVGAAVLAAVVAAIKPRAESDATSPVDDSAKPSDPGPRSP